MEEPRFCCPSWVSHGHTHPHWRRAPAGPPHLQDLFFVDVLLMAVRRVCHGPSDRSGCASLLMSAEDNFCLGRVALHLSSSGEDLHRTIAPFSLGLLFLFSCWVGSGAELVRSIPRLTWALVSESSTCRLCLGDGQRLLSWGASALIPVLFLSGGFLHLWPPWSMGAASLSTHRA